MPAEGPDHRIVVHLEKLLEERGITLTELAQRVDITIVNLSVLKNGRARAVRFSTLTALCEALSCQPGDLLTHDGKGGPGGSRGESRTDVQVPDGPDRRRSRG